VRIHLDPDLCQGHGRCYTLAPGLFDADDQGHCILLAEDVPDGEEEAARTGVLNCPEQALTLED
jgi:ferredoxin